MRRRIVSSAAGDLAAVANPGRAFRVGYRPDPWAWTPWQYADEEGRFTGRWDDPRGHFRTVYAGHELLGCLLEVLARFRPDPLLQEDLAHIDEDSDYPSLSPGVVPADWLSPRQASSAMLSGAFCAAADKESLATLRSVFLPAALRHGLADLDAGGLRLSAPRALTQEIAAWLYDLHDGLRPQFDGVEFQSRHGDGLVLWAVFEREDDGEVSNRITHAEPIDLDPQDPDLLEAFRIHRLTWEHRSGTLAR